MPIFVTAATRSVEFFETAYWRQLEHSSGSQRQPHSALAQTPLMAGIFRLKSHRGARSERVRAILGPMTAAIQPTLVMSNTGKTPLSSYAGNDEKEDDGSRQRPPSVPYQFATLTKDGELRSTVLDESSIPQLSDRPLKLLLRIHHDRPIPCDRFLDRLARHQQEADALVAGLHHDLVAAVKEHQRVIAHVVDGRRVRFRDLLGQNRTGCEESRKVPEPRTHKQMRCA